MGGEEGGGAFAFNFFAAQTGAVAAVAVAARGGSASSEGADADALEAAAEARAALVAEAEAECILHGPHGGAAQRGGQADWACFEGAEEVEAPAQRRASEDLAAAETLSEIQIPGTDIRLHKCAVTSDAAAALLGETQLQESDLVPGKYEGGFKLWEGAVDLAAYIAREHKLLAADVITGTPAESGLDRLRVLELGCGHGLPGVLCLLAGSEVHFQDYNREVLTSLTAPNVAANLARLPRGAVRPRARYFAGDWLAVGSLLSTKGLDASYDLVLTAETIYSPHGASRLLECIKQVLRPPHGVALVAAKSHYFGVGGGTAGFAAAVAADGTLEVERVWVVEDGASNKREILKLAFPASIVPYFM